MTTSTTWEQTEENLKKQNRELNTGQHPIINAMNDMIDCYVLAKTEPSQLWHKENLEVTKKIFQQEAEKLYTKYWIGVKIRNDIINAEMTNDINKIRLADKAYMENYLDIKEGDTGMIRFKQYCLMRKTDDFTAMLHWNDSFFKRFKSKTINPDEPFNDSMKVYYQYRCLEHPANAQSYTLVDEIMKDAREKTNPELKEKIKWFK